jgi:2,3-bisphosphoglycerate-independent phosphoglycerate mutase
LGEALRGAMDRYDLVVAHVRTPAEASIAGDAVAKVKALEAIDSLVVGPVLRRFDRLDQLGGGNVGERTGEGFRIMVAATAEVSCVDRAALDFPNLVAMGGTWMEGQVSRRLTERDAAAGDLRVEPGHEILEFFLRSGLHVHTRKPEKAKQEGGQRL